MTVYAQAFQNEHNNISDAVNEICPLLVKLSPLTLTLTLIEQSHQFSDVHGGIYLVNVFPSVYAIFFLIR